MTQENFLRKPFFGPLQSHATRRSIRRRGQALIEMALVVIVLMVLTLGLIQYGMIANAKVAMANLAREGARYAAVHGTETTSDEPSTTPNSIRHYLMTKVVPYTNLKDITDANIIIEPAKTDADPRTSGEPVTVTITYDMSNKFILPTSNLIPGLNNFGGLTRVSATMLQE